MAPIGDAQGGAFTRVAETLDWDDNTIALAAAEQRVCITEGVPEGGMLGPLAYTKIPNVFIKRLKEAGLGVATGVRIPAQWQGGAQGGVQTITAIFQVGRVLSLRASHLLVAGSRFWCFILFGRAKYILFW